MTRSNKIMSRRAFLKGAGSVAISLPFLDVMLASSGPAVAAGPGPVRPLITFFFANGCPPPLWLPQTTGSGFELLPAFEALRPHRDKIALISGLHDPAGKTGSGDDHSRGSGAFAVGAPNPFLDSDVVDAGGKRFASSAGGPSLEQFALQQLRPDTYLQSLEVGVMRGAPFTRTYHVKSWRGVNQPNPPILNPLDTFHRIFGRARTDDVSAKDERYRRSILDTVVPEYQRVTSERYGLNPSSRAMIGDHLDAVRDLERRALFHHSEMAASCLRPDRPESYVDTRYSEYAGVFKLQADMVAMALRCDITRYVSVMLGAGGEGFKLGDLGQAHHELGHRWNANPDNDFALYTRFQMEMLAYLLAELDDPAYVDADNRTVLDRSVLLAGTEISNPSRHDHDEMLYMVAGGAGQIRTGYHHRVGQGADRAVNDLYTACLHAVGVPAPSFGTAAFNREPLDLSQ